MKLAFLVVTVFLIGCSNQPTIDRNDPIDNALRACGLGYSTEVDAAFRLAYMYANNEGGVSFENKMKEALETQIVSLGKSQIFNEGMTSDDKILLIQNTQDCVVTFAETYRPPSRRDMIKECVSDIQERAAGIGSRRRVVTAQNWRVMHDDPRHDDENPIVYLELDSHSSAGISSGLVQCWSKNYEYKGFERVESMDE